MGARTADAIKGGQANLEPLFIWNVDTEETVTYQIVGHDDYLYVLNAVKSDLEQQDAKMETELKKYQGK